MSKKEEIQKREAMVIMVVGKKGVGKTVATIEMIYQYVNGDPANGVPPRKALIFDVNDEFSQFWFHGQTHSIKAIYIRDILKFAAHPKIEVRRIRPYLDNGNRMSLQDMQDVLAIILEKYRNGLLLVEDINKYTSDTLKADLVGSLATVRHLGVDLIAHYQSIGRAANPKLLGNTRMIRMHKTNDTVSRHDAKFEEKAEILDIAQSIVNKKYEEGDIRFFLYVDVDESKIRGKFTNEDIEYAIQDYVSRNYNKLIRPMMRKIDMTTGEKLYTEKEALVELVKNMKQTYFVRNTKKK